MVAFHKANVNTLLQLNIKRGCPTARCVKGFQSFNPLAFTHVPPEVTASKLIARTGWLEIQFGIDKFTVLFRQRNLRLLFMFWMFLFHENLSLTSENIELFSQWRVNPFRCPTNDYREGS